MPIPAGPVIPNTNIIPLEEYCFNSACLSLNAWSICA